MKRCLPLFTALFLLGCGGQPTSIVGGLPFAQETSDSYNSTGASIEEGEALARASRVSQKMDRGRSNFAGVTVDANWVQYDDYDFVFVADRSSKSSRSAPSLDQSSNIGLGAAGATGCRSERVIREDASNNYIAIMSCERL